MAAGTVNNVEGTSVGKLMGFRNLPGIGVIKVFLHRVHGDGHHIGTLLAGLVGLVYRALDVAVVIRVAVFAQTIHLPVLVGGHAVEGDRAGDQTQLAAAGRGIDDQRFGGVGFGFVRAGLGDAIGLKRVPQTGDAIRPLIPGMVGGVCAGVVSHVAGGIRHFRRNVEDRVRGIWAAALGDRGFEFAHGDVRSLNVLLHRREQRVEVEGGAIRGVGVRALEMAPQSLMEQQIAVDQHGDAVRIRAIR